MNYEKGTKVRHKAKGMEEAIVGLCKVKVYGQWLDGVIYEGNDTVTGKPMTFVRLKEDFENNFELCGYKEIVMNKYRVVEAKDRYGYAWYFPQRLSCEGTWEDINQGCITLEAAMDRIRRDITHCVVWEGTEEDVLKPMQEFQDKYEND